ncbi:hypothetical protein EVAR_36300_1 [Eumeta japonica]|uniref:Uncharacterized protein n=1 Tax=Eumeta variegata TaxID=151549 RepID=A0A4C1VGV5_EUMVA|nr:hypothetical protein EVAR_36300_1 [Eumeta japonica]
MKEVDTSCPKGEVKLQLSTSKFIEKIIDKGVTDKGVTDYRKQSAFILRIFLVRLQTNQPESRTHGESEDRQPSNVMSMLLSTLFRAEDARNSAAVKLVAQASQWRKIETWGTRRKERGALNLQIVPFASNSKWQTFKHFEESGLRRPRKQCFHMKRPSKRSLSASGQNVSLSGFIKCSGSLPTIPIRQSSGGDCGYLPGLLGNKRSIFFLTLMDFIITTLGTFLVMTLLCCLCCISMKLSDLRMQRYILDMAKSKGVKVDIDTLNAKRSAQSPLANEHCTIIVPEVGIIL